MIRPVGPKDGNGEFPVTKVPSGAGAASKVAQGKLEKAVFRPKEFEAEKKIPNRKEGTNLAILGLFRQQRAQTTGIE